MKKKIVYTILSSAAVILSVIACILLLTDTENTASRLSTFYEFRHGIVLLPCLLSSIGMTLIIWKQKPKKESWAFGWVYGMFLGNVGYYLIQIIRQITKIAETNSVREILLKTYYGPLMVLTLASFVFSLLALLEVFNYYRRMWMFIGTSISLGALTIVSLWAQSIFVSANIILSTKTFENPWQQFFYALQNKLPQMWNHMAAVLLMGLGILLMCVLTVLFARDERVKAKQRNARKKNK